MTGHHNKWQGPGNGCRTDDKRVHVYSSQKKRVTQVDRVVKKPIGLFAIISHVTTVHEVGDITPGAKKLSKTVSINMKKGPKSKRHLSIPSPATA